MSTRPSKALGIEYNFIDMPRPEAVGAAMRQALAEGARDAVVRGSPYFSSVQRRRIIDSAAEHRLPAIYERRDDAERGGLVSYAPGVGIYPWRAGPLSMAWRSVRQIASRMPAGSQRQYRHRHVFVHCGQSLQSMIPIMIIEPAATATEQITGNSSRTAITAARPLWFRAKRQLATPIRKLRLAKVASF
jgi:hypothetical protein